MSSYDRRQSFMSSSSQDSGNVSTTLMERSSTPASAFGIDSSEQSMYEPSFRHPTEISRLAHLSSPTSVANNIVELNLPHPTEESSHEQQEPNRPSQFGESSMVQSSHQLYNGNTQALADNNAFSSSTLDSPHGYNIRANNPALLSMSLEEINALQNRLTAEMMDVEMSIRQVRNDPNFTPLAEDENKQKRRPSFGARAA